MVFSAIVERRNSSRRQGRQLRSGLSILLAFGLLAVALVAAERDDDALPVLESGIATATIESRRASVSYSLTRFGPRVSLHPLVAALGGALEVGPLEERHELTIDAASFLFGPGAHTVTSGDEIIRLSQPPVIGPTGLEVPLDFLDLTFGRLRGYDFLWQHADRKLEVTRRPERRLRMTLDVVDLQGVTTLVFSFPETPRYRIERAPSRVEIALLGDRIEYDGQRRFRATDLVRDVRLTPQKIVIDFAANAVAQDYLLEEPFRLVFDVVPDRGRPRAPAAHTTPRGRAGTGVRTIVLDPGHGGADTGAIGASGVTEKELTLKIARTLQQALQARMPVRVVLTRDDDVDLSLDGRSAIANQYKADLFISLHLNAWAESSAQGAETYFSSLEASDERAAAAAVAENRGDPLADLQLILWDLAQSHHMAESQRFASLVQAELNQTLSLRNRGVKQAPFRVLMGAAMPAVLVELGFLSNPREESQLEDPEYRRRLVDALARAIGRYKAQVEGRPVETPAATEPAGAPE